MWNSCAAFNQSCTDWKEWAFDHAMPLAMAIAPIGHDAQHDSLVVFKHDWFWPVGMTVFGNILASMIKCVINRSWPIC